MAAGETETAEEQLAADADDLALRGKGAARSKVRYQSSLGGAESFVCGAKSSLGGAKSSLGGAESSLGDV